MESSSSISWWLFAIWNISSFYFCSEISWNSSESSLEFLKWTWWFWISFLSDWIFSRSSICSYSCSYYFLFSFCSNISIYFSWISVFAIIPKWYFFSWFSSFCFDLSYSKSLYSISFFSCARISLLLAKFLIWYSKLLILDFSVWSYSNTWLYLSLQYSSFCLIWFSNCRIIFSELDDFDSAFSRIYILFFNYAISFSYCSLYSCNDSIWLLVST